MARRVPHLLSVAIVFGMTTVARAELVTYDVTQDTAGTLESLGTKFVLGCAIIALGIVIAAFFVSRKR
jgi:hypothetical protein